jgi:phage shock protein C
MTKTNTKHHLQLSKNKLFLGVVGGIAQSANVSYALARLIAVILVVFTGIVPGVIIYLIVYFIIRSESHT